MRIKIGYVIVAVEEVGDEPTLAARHETWDVSAKGKQVFKSEDEVLARNVVFNKLFPDGQPNRKTDRTEIFTTKGEAEIVAKDLAITYPFYFKAVPVYATLSARGPWFRRTN